MSYKKRFFILLFTFQVFIFSGNLNSQSITPFTFNNGGGFSSTMEWSIGQSVSIASFNSSGYTLNTGVLQPLTNIVTSINEFGPTVFGTQITIGPNPTMNILHIHAKFNEAGNFSYQLIDSKSAILFTNDVGTVYSSYDKDIAMEKYSPGVFYIKVIFKSINNKIKTGIYKIIKL
jgi:hypothetical protein